MSTIRVKRANVVLDIRQDEKKKYMEQGFSVIDAKSGKVLEEAMPKDVASLQSLVRNLKNQLAEKDAYIEKLVEANKRKSK